MKAQFDQNLLSSFYLWLENRLLKDDTKAYLTNVQNSFKYIDFNDIPQDMVGYQGEYRQLVAESNIDVSNSGFFINGNFITGNPQQNGGILLDYQNGRILLPSGSGTSLQISGNFSVKEVNTYISHDNDLDFILHSDFIENGQDSPYLYGKGNKLDEGSYFLPACFVSIASSENEEFCFGGEEDTKTRIRVMVLTKDSYIMDSVISRLRDTARERITHIPYEDFPYGYSYSIKNFPYFYSSLKISQGASAAISHIEKVSVSKVISEELRENLNKNFSIALVDFDLSTYRFPRL
jgi:hypothetical protein